MSLMDGTDEHEEDNHALLPKRNVAAQYFLEDKSADPALILEQSNQTDFANWQLKTALEQLDPRARTIVEQRWLVEKKATLHDLAAKYNVSAERVRQLEANAIKN